MSSLLKTTIEEEQLFTRNEVSIHNTENSLWIIVDNNVYDVTSYLEKHPGGREALMRMGGKDATNAIRDQPAHKSVPTFIRRLLKDQFLVGCLEEAESS